MFVASHLQTNTECTTASAVTEEQKDNSKKHEQSEQTGVHLVIILTEKKAQ